MARQEENVDRLKKLVEILEDLQNNVTPESGLFLNNLKKKFAGFQTEAEDILTELTGEDAHAAQKKTEAAIGRTTVFISLFQAEPENVKQWQKTVRRISEYSLTRSIYRKVEHVEELIRSRPDPRKEAYAIVTLHDTDIISAYAGKSEQDINGHDLLTVKEGAVKPENVEKFVHGSQIFLFKDGQLILQNSGESFL